jgi:hypothetical protein
MSKEPQEPILLTDDGAIAAPPALVRAGLETLPVAIVAAGARTSEPFIEFSRRTPAIGTPGWPMPLPFGSSSTGVNNEAFRWRTSDHRP